MTFKEANEIAEQAFFLCNTKGALSRAGHEAQKPFANREQEQASWAEHHVRIAEYTVEWRLTQQKAFADARLAMGWPLRDIDTAPLYS